MPDCNRPGTFVWCTISCFLTSAQLIERELWLLHGPSGEVPDKHRQCGDSPHITQNQAAPYANTLPVGVIRFILTVFCILSHNSAKKANFQVGTWGGNSVVNIFACTCQANASTSYNIYKIPWGWKTSTSIFEALKLKKAFKVGLINLRKELEHQLFCREPQEDDQTVKQKEAAEMLLKSLMSRSPKTDIDVSCDHQAVMLV